MSKNTWMIRAGEGGHLIDEFTKGVVTVGWRETGELVDKSQRDLRLRLAAVFPDAKAGKNQNTASVLWRFAQVIKVGDNVVTYDPTKREYCVGEITSGYQYEPKKFKEHPHTRSVEWKTRVPRDILSVSTRNSLGSTLTLFAVPDDAIADIWAASKTDKPVEISGGLTDKKEQLQQSNKDAAQEALELVEDKILDLDEYEMQDLVAALLRAMGYKTRTSARGPDRGVDVIASPDGLGFQEPRIKVEVKHRPKSGMGAPDIRSFQQTLRGNYKGLYVSTGGFSREAHYEAERAETPVTLIDLTALAQLVTEHYEKFDPAGRTLIPLVRIYRPAE